MGLPAMTTTGVKAKYKAKTESNVTYVAKISALRTPMISGMPSIVDKNGAVTAHRPTYGGPCQARLAPDVERPFPLT